MMDIIYLQIPIPGVAKCHATLEPRIAPQLLRFNNYLIGATDNNFRFPTVAFYDTRDANPFPLKKCLRRILKLIPVRPPNENRKNLLWVWLIKI